MFYLVHESRERFATRVEGQLIGPRTTTPHFEFAVSFDTWREASEAAQNFGPDWEIEEV